MTSVDSGIETSNNSDDSSIAQNKHAETEEINNVSSALTTITSNQNDIHEIDPETLRIALESDSFSLANVIFPISQFVPINEFYKYFNNGENCIPTSSSGPVPSSNVLSTVQKLKRIHFYRTMRRRSQYSVPLFDCHTDFLERLYSLRMRIAAVTNNIMLMRRLLSYGASPNNCDFLGRTPLHLASCRGYTEMVQLLLEHGANPNLRDSVGNTPLHLAAVTSKISVVTLLLNAGTHPLCLDQDGYNPLQLAQTKLRLLQNCKGEDMMKVKEEVQSIVSMLWAYLQKREDSHKRVETLSTLCSRLSLSNTSEEIQDDVKDLLANLDALSITQ